MKNILLNLLIMGLLLAAPAAFAQTAQPGQTVPSAEPPVKVVPQAGHQPKPQPVDEPAAPDYQPGPDHGGPDHAGRRAARGARHAHGPGGHGPGGHGPDRERGMGGHGRH